MASFIEVKNDLSQFLQREMNIDQMKVTSPLTGSEDVILEERLDPNKIISNYRSEYGFDPSGYFENLDGVAIYRCNETGYRFYHPACVAGNSKLYEHLQKISWYYASWRWEHELAYKQITERDEVLEVGCGFGSFLQKLRDRNVRCAGLEFNPRAVETATVNGLQVYPETIHDHANRNPGRYSVVCSFQVVEHISAVGDFITDCIAAIKPHGKLMISVPNNNPFLFRLDKYNALNVPPHHMGLWNKKSLKQLQKIFPLTDYKIWIEPLYNRKEYFEIHLNHLRSKWPRIGMLADPILRPFFRPIMKLVATFVEGRNLFAIYTKTPG
jgi:2-polyprenyl-3-methyl-5-hydroxy-6-metoxy-1,4-benzoquinol methylase